MIALGNTVVTKADTYRLNGRDELRIYLAGDACDDNDFVYERRDDKFFAEYKGIVRYFVYSGPDDGFDGAYFRLNMKDGSTAVLKGPWSSRSSVMNTAGFTPSREVHGVEPRLLNDGTVSMDYPHHWAMSITVDKFNEILRHFNLKVDGKEQVEGKVESLISNHPSCEVI